MVGLVEEEWRSNKGSRRPCWRGVGRTGEVRGRLLRATEEVKGLAGSGLEERKKEEQRAPPAGRKAKAAFVIGNGSSLGSVEGAKPNSSRFVGVTNLRCPFSPWPLSYASIMSLPPTF
ncbi:hypothetical protein SDJN03_28499, partial [Cucurbita argyrosperma subsp. sororia]